ncbi:hypothetical protein [Arthrobacter sp. KBS0703]|uniref:hypothetical protein n=1 Tax=Arthrobacter sp. KBS0703 TaxID=1955698 RepID=UPI0021B13AAC|nr:hypothetical protein [Arthrobacter sp. KBS0703]
MVADIRSATSAAARRRNQAGHSRGKNGWQGGWQYPRRGARGGGRDGERRDRRQDNPRKQVPDGVDVVDDGTQHVAALQEAPEGQGPLAQRLPEGAPQDGQ